MPTEEQLVFPGMADAHVARRQMTLAELVVATKIVARRFNAWLETLSAEIDAVESRLQGDRQ